MGIDEQQLHIMLNFKELNVKVYILNDFIYMKFKSRQKLIKALEVSTAFTLGGLMSERGKRDPAGVLVMFYF